MKYQSTKTYGHDVGLSACFRQWRATSHCKHLHGYALAVSLKFEADELDANNWVVDFGGLRSFRTWLETMFDHKTLVANDDPKINTFERLHKEGLIRMKRVPNVGCEAFAAMIAEACADWLFDTRQAPRVRLVSVEVREHGANSAIVLL